MKIEKCKEGRNWTSFATLSNLIDVMRDCTMPDTGQLWVALFFIYGSLSVNKSLFCTDILLFNFDMHQGIVYI